MANRDGPMLVDGQPFKIRYRVFNFHGGQTVGSPTGEYENLGRLRRHRRRWTASRSSRSDVWMV